MAIWHVYVVGQCRSRQGRTNPAHIDDVMRHTKPLRSGGGVVDFFAVPLTVVKTDQPGQFVFFGNHLGKRNRIQPARADNNSLHLCPLF